MPTVKGTASVTDSRARTKALRNTRFPRNFRKSVDLEKVNKPVLTQWIEQKITLILGFDDEIVSSTAINLFLPSDNSCDPKKAQLDLTGFLGDDTATFCAELWSLMLEAQASASGIPQTLLERKKKEIAEKLSKSNEGQHDQKTNQFQWSIGNPNGSGQNVLATNANPTVRNPSVRHDDQTNKFKNAGRETIGEPKQQHENSKPKDGSEKQSTDQFGRVVPTERSRDVQRQTSRNQHDRTDTRSRPRERSRSRERYNDRERETRDYRRRSDDRHRGTDVDRRRVDDRRYYPNQYNDRSGHHDHYHRHYSHQYDRDRNRDQYHNQYHDSRDRRDRRYEDHERENFERIQYRRFDDQEMENLERRLAQLRKQYSGRDKRNTGRSMHSIEDEMNDIQYRMDEIERRRRRNSSSRGDDRRHRSYRDRSPSHENRRNERRQRSNSANSESSRSMESSGDDKSSDGSTSSRGSSNRSYSPSPERSKKSKSKSSKKRQRRRRSRSRSSSQGSEQSS